MADKLQRLEEENKSIQVAIVGMGKMGTSLVDRILKIKGMEPALIINRNNQTTRESLMALNVAEDAIGAVETLEELEDNIKARKISVTTDFTLSYLSPSIDVIVEATGDPAFGAEVAYTALQNKKHMVMLNVECDAVIGPTLLNVARKNQVIYTGASGDEPAAIIELINFAKGLGFPIIAAGKGKNNPPNRYATHKDLQERAEANHLNVQKLTSFVDTTNTMIELNAVANATGFVPDTLGCHGLTSDLKSLADKFQLIKDGGDFTRHEVLDYVQGVAPGVFVVIQADSTEAAETLGYVGMGHGPNYLLYRPYHLTSLEIPISIYRAVVDEVPVLAPVKGQVCDTITFAKRDMKAGETLGGIGSDDTYGLLTTYEDGREKNALPIALITEHTKLLQDVKRDELITYDMVALDESQLIVQLRKEQDHLHE